MPLSFIALPTRAEAIVLNPEEKNFLAYVQQLEPQDEDPASRYSVTVNIEVKFTRSKAKDAIGIQITNNPNAPAVRITEEQIRERYPWDYDRLTRECRNRYQDFKAVDKYHNLRRKFLSDSRLGFVRYLDPGNPKSSKKSLFDPNILKEFDKHYTRNA
jgi:hypothetical protein